MPARPPTHPPPTPSPPHTPGRRFWPPTPQTSWPSSGPFWCSSSTTRAPRPPACCSRCPTSARCGQGGASSRPAVLAGCCLVAAAAHIAGAACYLSVCCAVVCGVRSSRHGVPGQQPASRPAASSRRAQRCRFACCVGAPRRAPHAGWRPPGEWVTRNQNRSMLFLLQERLDAFKGTLFGTGSEKAQRDAIKKLLVGSHFLLPKLFLQLLEPRCVLRRVRWAGRRRPCNAVRRARRLQPGRLNCTVDPPTPQTPPPPHTHKCTQHSHMHSRMHTQGKPATSHPPTRPRAPGRRCPPAASRALQRWPTGSPLPRWWWRSPACARPSLPPRTTPTSSSPRSSSSGGGGV